MADGVDFSNPLIAISGFFGVFVSALALLVKVIQIGLMGGIFAGLLSLFAFLFVGFKIFSE